MVKFRADGGREFENGRARRGLPWKAGSDGAAESNRIHLPKIMGNLCPNEVKTENFVCCPQLFGDP